MRRVAPPYSRLVDDYDAACRSVAQTVRAVAVPLVEAGVADAELGTDGGGHQLRPRKATAAAVSVYMQSQHEVSLWPRAPGTDRAPTVDIYDVDRARLLSSLREYLDAIVAGRIELTLRKGSSAGRCRLWLSDGSCSTHLYNVLRESRVGRGEGWETFRPDAY